MRSKIKSRYYKCKSAFRTSKTTLLKILKERVTYEIVGITVIFLTIWVYIPRFPPFLPNVLDIRYISTGSAILTSIIASLGAILGIVIAVMLVAFEILRKTYASYAVESFFKDSYVKEIVFIYIATIFVSVLTLASLSDPLSSRDLDLIYYSLFLFAYSLIILFPHSQKIIRATQSKKRIKDLVGRIDGKEIDFFRIQNYLMVTPVHNFGDGDYDVVTPPIEENPIFILSEVAVRALKDDDRIIPRFIIAETTKKLLTILKDISKHDVARETIKVFLSIYKNTAIHAMKSRQEGTLYTLLNIFEEIHSFCTKNKLPWNVVIELNDTLVEIIEETIKSNLINVGQRGLYTIERIMKEHLEKNIPREDEIWLFQMDNKSAQYDSNKDLQWQMVSDSYILMVFKLAETAIELQKSEVVNTGLFVLEGIATEVMDMNLGDRQKTSIIRWSYYYVRELIIKCVEEGLYRKGIVRPHFLSMDKALDKRALYSNIPLMTFSDILIQLAQRKTFDSFILNELGTLGRGSIDKMEKDALYKDSVIYIIKVFDKIKKIIEENLNDENKRIYIEIYKQLESFKRWMENHEEKDSDVEKALTEVINSFGQLDQIKRDFERETIIWGN